MRSAYLAPIALLVLSACGKDDSNARVANMSQQEADALNDAAAIIDERTDKVENALNEVGQPTTQPAASPAEQAGDNPQKK